MGSYVSNHKRGIGEGKKGGRNWVLFGQPLADWGRDSSLSKPRQIRESSGLSNSHKWRAPTSRIARIIHLRIYKIQWGFTPFWVFCFTS